MADRVKNKDKPPAQRDPRWWKRWRRKRAERIRRGEISAGRFVGGTADRVTGASLGLSFLEQFGEH